MAKIEIDSALLGKVQALYPEVVNLTPTKFVDYLLRSIIIEEYQPVPAEKVDMEKVRARIIAAIFHIGSTVSNKDFKNWIRIWQYEMNRKKRAVVFCGIQE